MDTDADDRDVTYATLLREPGARSMAVDFGRSFKYFSDDIFRSLSTWTA